MTANSKLYHKAIEEGLMLCTMRQWNERGYYIKKGERFYCRSKAGAALFSHLQVSLLTYRKLVEGSR